MKEPSKAAHTTVWFATGEKLAHCSPTWYCVVRITKKYFDFCHAIRQDEIALNASVYSLATFFRLSDIKEDVSAKLEEATAVDGKALWSYSMI